MENKKTENIKKTEEKINYIKKTLENKEVCKQFAHRLTNYIKGSNI